MDLNPVIYQGLILGGHCLLFSGNYYSRDPVLHEVCHQGRPDNPKAFVGLAKDVFPWPYDHNLWFWNLFVTSFPV